MKKTFTFRLLNLLVVLLLGVCHTTGATFQAIVNGANLEFETLQRSNSYNGNQQVKVKGFAPTSGFSGVLHIPATVTYSGVTYNITEIYDKSFMNRANITGVIFDRISIINYGAFMRCPNLEFVEIKSLFCSTYAGISTEAFMDCEALTTVYLPQKLDVLYNNPDHPNEYNCTINGRTFLNCKKLTNFIISNDDPNAEHSFYTRNGVLYFNHDGRKLVCYPQSKTNTSFTMPSNVTKLASAAFIANPYLENVTISEGVEVLPEEVLVGCLSLKSVTLPNSIKQIDAWAFAFCQNLKSIKLPYYLEKIGFMAFGEAGLTSVTARSPRAPACNDNSFSEIESNIDLTVPVGSNYAEKAPWNRMKSITESDNVLEKYGIRVAGTEVNELNYNDVLEDGGKVKFRNDILTLNNVDISYSGGRLIENYGVDELYINVVGNCSLTSSSDHPFLFQKSTTIYGDTLTVSGLSTIESDAPVTLANTAFMGIASSRMFNVQALTIFGNTAFIGNIGSNATVGYIGNLTLGAGSELVGWERGHNLTYDSNEHTILDNGEAMAGGSYFAVGMPFPLYYNGIHLSTATNYLFGEYFQMLPGIEGGYILKGQVYGVSSGETPVLRSAQDGLELDLEGETYVIAAGSAPAIELNGNASFGGTGSLKVVSSENAGIYISRGRLTIENLDLDIRGYTAGIKGLAKYGTNYLANLELYNVAGTIKSTSSGSPSIMTVNTLTLEDCHAVNGASFNSSSHNVDAQQLVLARNQNVPTGIDDELVSVEERQEAKDSKLYDLQGHRVLIPQPRHIYIIRNADGSVKKIRFGAE